MLKSSAAARICSPIVVRLRNCDRTTSSDIVTTMVMTSRRGTTTPPNLQLSRVQGCTVVDLGSDPKIVSARLASAKLTANDVTSIVAGLAPRTPRKATSSSTTPITTQTTTVTSTRTTSGSPDVSTIAYAPPMIRL